MRFHSIIGNLKRKLKGQWDGIDMLDLVPQSRVATDPGSSPDRVILLQPRYSGPVWGRILQPLLPEARKFVRIPLDPRGSLIWSRIDGETPIRGMTEGWEDRFPEDADQVHQRICLFLGRMHELGFISLLKPAS